MRDPTYGIFIILHVLSAVIGFGTLITSGIYSFMLKKTTYPISSKAIAKYFNGKTNYAGYVIFLVPVFGIILLYLHNWHQLVHPYPWVGMACWIIGSSIAATVIFPQEKKLGLIINQDTNQFAKEEFSISNLENNISNICQLNKDAKNATVPDSYATDIKSIFLRIERASSVTTLCFLVALVFMVLQPAF